MTTGRVAGRAALSVVLLAGFYVLAFVQCVAGFGLSLWASVTVNNAIGVKLGTAVFLGTVWAVGYGTWKAVRAGNADPPGVVLTPQHAPLLWQTVRELAAAVGTRAPDVILLVAEANAAVGERTRLMGLLGGRRHLYVGMPLLQTFTVAQLRSVLAHELGHYSGRHTRFAGVSYRGRLALERTIAQIHPSNLTGWVFRAYARLFIRVQNAVSRRQELEADLASVRIAGRVPAAVALREVEVLDHALGFYLARVVRPGLDAGYVPEDMFAGFLLMLQARAEEISALRARLATGSRPDDPWDTHPPLGARIAAIMAAPETVVAVDHGPAAGLVADLPAAGRALQAVALQSTGAVVLPWDDFRTAAQRAELQEQADAMLRAFTRAVGRPVPDVGAVLDLIAAGRVEDLAAPLFPDATREAARTRFAAPLETLLRLAAVRSGVARWQHSWSGPPRLLTLDGARLDLSEEAALAVDPATLPAARRRLHERGVDVAAAVHVRRRLGVGDARAVAGITTVIVDGRRADLLILTDGLLLVPGMPRYKTGLAGNRMRRRLAGGDVRDLAAAPGSRFIPYEDIAVAAGSGSARFRWQLTLHDGTAVEIHTGLQSEQHADGKQRFAEAMRAATT